MTNYNNPFPTRRRARMVGHAGVKVKFRGHPIYEHRINCPFCNRQNLLVYTGSPRPPQYCSMDCKSEYNKQRLRAYRQRKKG